MRRPAWALWFGLALAGWPAADAAGAGAGGDASLLVDVEPRVPWVGQPVVLRVRLVLLRDLAEEPAYVPPVTTGFWTEPPSRPESYYGTVGGRRVLVTETRTRLYPLAPGVARIGSAAADVVFTSPEGLQETGGRAPPRELSLRSAPVAVTVRPLPAGAPEGFEGAVGTFAPVWSADRARTSLDVPVAVRLDVRGSGNLALVKAPALVVPGAEVLAGARDDSLPSPGSSGAGRVRFQWNVLARRIGRLAIQPPRFAWFDPATGGYRRAVLPSLAAEIGPALFSSGPDADAFPEALGADAPDPFARGARPWAWAVAGLLLGASVVSWRRRPAPDPLAEERGRLAAWRNVLRGPGGPAFWRAAEESLEWLERVRGPLERLRVEVQAARYGGEGGDVEGVRSRLQEALGTALPRPSRGMPGKAVAVAVAVSGLLVLALAGLRAGEEGGRRRLREAGRISSWALKPPTVWTLARSGYSLL